MATQPHGHWYRSVPGVILIVLCLPFLLFIGILAAPAVLLFTPLFMLWGVERATVEHGPLHARAQAR